MTAPPQIADLVSRFDRNAEAYRSPAYNEEQLRAEFLNPFFIALGWDVYNASGFAEPYKDVVFEQSVKIGGATKAPDYCFRIGQARKFFVEAKKPAIDLKNDSGPAYQLRRYAWSAKLPLSILSDFEEFAVYDCRSKPSPEDKASSGRILYLTYTDYLERWNEIADYFSKDAVLKGSFDKFAESAKKKKGTAEVDSAFLKEIESWRETLAKNIALRNPRLSNRELNFAVTNTIDRLIFLRIGEDRGIENYGQLQALQNGERVYPRLFQLFANADDRYNSGLFHFKPEKDRPEPDTLTPKLEIDDKILKDIIKSLYYPDSPYEFSVLPADILGQVYEQFLGKVIRLTPGHQAKVEAKPEVKKAGGVYYTPTYIVDYIVKNTVGKLLEGKTPEQVSGRLRPASERDGRDPTLRQSAKGGLQSLKRKSSPPLLRKGGDQQPLRILDPACGSGSFLLGAYQFLLDWYLDQYLKESEQCTVNSAQKDGQKPELERNAAGAPDFSGAADFRGASAFRVAPAFRGAGARTREPSKNLPLYQTSTKTWKLTTSERKRILLDHIFGVDIDQQAVEVTKLSLLLKCLEGETEASIHQLKLFYKQRALPDLSANIKCGNSLIGSDFYHNQQMTMFDQEEILRINAFDWDKEFSEVFNHKGTKDTKEEAGFDVVIGNPPYVRQEVLGEQFKEYAKRHFSTYAGTADLYVYFIEKSHRLLRIGGYFGMICSNKFIRANYGKALRDFLAIKSKLFQIVDFGELPVFQNAATFPAIILTMNIQTEEQHFIYAPIKRLSFQSLTEEVKLINSKLDILSMKGDNWALATNRELSILTKLKIKSLTLGEYLKDDIYRGIVTGLNDVFIINEELRNRLIKEDKSSSEIIKPFVMGDDIRKYHINYKSKFLIFARRGIDINKYPAIERYLNQFKELLQPKPKNWKGSNWKGRKSGAYQWYEIQDTIDYYDLFEKPKIVYPDIAKENRIAFDSGALYLANTIYFIPTDDLYLLGLMNSKLIFNYYKRNSAVLGDADKGGRLRWFRQDVLRLPIRAINLSDPSEKSRHSKVVELVARMLDLHKQKVAAKVPAEREALYRQIAATDAEIDGLVYELYGLTEEEIKIVEGQ